MNQKGDEFMNLIISVLKKEDLHNQKIIETIQKNINQVEIIYAEDMSIKGCIGCNRCWLVTPGVCTIKDDYEKLLIKYLQSKQVIFITDLKLGFVSYQLKNIIDRILPLATMNLRFKNGQMRHYPRYKKHLKMGLIYKGNGNPKFLEKWFERVMINLDGTSIGTYHIENEEEILNALIHC